MSIGKSTEMPEPNLKFKIDRLIINSPDAARATSV